jgi:xylan 1,4-beta-xylosidase
MNKIIIDCSDLKEGPPLMTGDLGWDEYADTVSELGLTNLKPIGEAPKGTFRYIRIHNMFSGPEGDHRGKRDAGGQVVRTTPDGNYYYDWTIVDKVLQTILDVNCIPFLELGFTPSQWSSIPDGEIVRYKDDPTPMDAVENPLSFYPPKDYSLWADLVEEFLIHIEKKFGTTVKTWPVELWNEPDIRYFNGTLEQYCELWKITHGVCKKHQMQIVGAPGVAHLGPFFTGVLEYSIKNKCKLDFISYHVKGGQAGSDLSNPLMIWGNLLEGRDRILKFEEYKNTPIYITELDPEVGCELGIVDRPNLEWRNESYYASWLGKMCYLFAVMQRGWSYGENEYDENIRPFYCYAQFNDAHHITGERETFYGARCLTTPVWIKEAGKIKMAALKKPIFRAFEYTRFLKGQNIPFFDEDRNIFGVLAYNDDRLFVCVVLHDDHFTKTSPLTEICLKIENLPRNQFEIEETIRIDRESANAYQVWKKMNSPREISSHQYEELLEASKVKKLQLTQTIHGENSIEISFTAEGHSFNFISLH